jgi:hypothetical protein
LIPKCLRATSAVDFSSALVDPFAVRDLRLVSINVKTPMHASRR